MTLLGHVRDIFATSTWLAIYSQFVRYYVAPFYISFQVALMSLITHYFLANCSQSPRWFDFLRLNWGDFATTLRLLCDTLRPCCEMVKIAIILNLFKSTQFNCATLRLQRWNCKASDLLEIKLRIEFANASQTGLAQWDTTFRSCHSTCHRRMDIISPHVNLGDRGL